MGHNWIIDVLADLESYAHRNGLTSVAEQMNVAALVATAEIASLSEGASQQAPRDEVKVRSVSA